MVGKFPRQCACASRIVRCRVAIQLAILFVGSIPALSKTDTKNHDAVHTPAVTRQRISGSPRNQPPAKLALQLTPNLIRFEEVPVGELSSQMVRLTNISDELLQIYRIELPGVEFRVTGQALPFVIASGTSADFTVSYRPQSEVHEFSRVLVYAAERLEPLVIDLIASAVPAQQELVASVATLDFSDVPIGTVSAKTISLRNIGNREVVVASPTVTGDSSFDATGQGGIKLAPGQKFELLVNFHPTNTGVRSAVLKIPETLEVPLVGTGVQGSSSVIKLQWEGVPAGDSGFAVYRSADASGPYEQIAGSLSATEYLDSGLAAGHTYYYVVTSPGAGEVGGEFSAPISATVPEG